MIYIFCFFLHFSTDQVTTDVFTSRMDIFSIEAVDNLCSEQIQKVDRTMTKFREEIETRNKEVRDLHVQISQRRTELIKLINKANNKLEMLKGFTG